jgi:copper chaperone CopZ
LVFIRAPGDNHADSRKRKQVPLLSVKTFVTVERQTHLMRTKTAIISIENLKTEDFPKLETALKAVSGVDSVEFSVERSVAVLDFDPSQSHIDDFLRAVLIAGFKVL